MSKQKSILDYFGNRHKVSAEVQNCSENNNKNACEVIILDEEKATREEANKKTGETKKPPSQSECRLNDPYVCVAFDRNEFVEVGEFLEVDFHVDEDEGNENEFNNNDYGLFIYKNFRLVIDCVLRDQMNSHLFSDDDWKMIESFTSLNGLAQMLFIRLFLRKQDWIRTKTIKYPEICENLPFLVNELTERDFLQKSDVIEDIREALGTMDVIELKSLAKSFNGINMAGQTTKSKITCAILQHIKTCRPVCSWDTNSLEEVFLKRTKKLLGSTCIRVNENVRLLFESIFMLISPPELNDEDFNLSLSSEIFKFLQVETGKINYQNYKMNKSEIIYRNREELFAFCRSCRLESEILYFYEKKKFSIVSEKYLPVVKQAYEDWTHFNFCSSQVPVFLRRFTAGYILIRCLSHCVEVLEKQKDYEAANNLLNCVLLRQHLFCQDYRGRWYERLALNLEKHLKRPEMALDVVEEALQDPQVRLGHHLAIYLRRKNLQKLLNKNVTVIPELEELQCPETSIDGDTLKYKIEGRINIFKKTNLNGDVTLTSVEEVVIDYYKHNGFTDGIHSEGLVYHAIFGLLFWDIIYLDNDLVPDSFRFLCQQFPLDFNTDAFYIRRQPLINSKIDEIKSFTDIKLIEALEKSWNLNINKFSLVNWEKLSFEQIQKISLLLGPKIIAGICERLVKDFRFTRSGFPDLLIWNSESGNIRAVEVKGPGDRLSTKQILWLAFMKSLGLSAEVCRVNAKKSF